MRRFLCDYTQIFTMDEVRHNYNLFCDYKDECSFSEYLFEALGKNGSLVEILTCDTPRYERKGAVCFCAVVDSSADIETMHDDTRWLNWYDIQRLQDYGYHVVPTAYDIKDWV